jgi:tRNA pseudouridine55 synthase
VPVDLLAGGVFLLDKPCGPTSFWVVRQVRRLLAMKKVGHAGTLDPFASGLLIVCAGRAATRAIDTLMAGEKEYVATLCLGVRTSTGDPEGEIIERRPAQTFTDEQLEAVLNKFRGGYWQTPPAYSALKHRGKPLYAYARKGIVIDKPPRQVLISSLSREILAFSPIGVAALTIRVRCGKGTYIRKLAEDIGDALGCGAHLTALRRTMSGPFQVERAVLADALRSEDGFGHLLAAKLSEAELAGLLQEKALPATVSEV